MLQWMVFDRLATWSKWSTFLFFCSVLRFKVEQRRFAFVHSNFSGTVDITIDTRHIFGGKLIHEKSRRWISTRRHRRGKKATTTKKCKSHPYHWVGRTYSIGEIKSRKKWSVTSYCCCCWFEYSQYSQMHWIMSTWFELEFWGTSKIHNFTTTQRVNGANVHTNPPNRATIGPNIQWTQHWCLFPLLGWFASRRFLS